MRSNNTSVGLFVCAKNSNEGEATSKRSTVGLPVPVNAKMVPVRNNSGARLIVAGAPLSKKNWPAKP
jgi:hypothetical protein